MVHETQPAAHHEMSHKPKEGFVEKYSEKAAEEAGKETVKYLKKNGPPSEQQIDDAEAKAQQEYDNAKQQAEGMWAKYCGCLSSLS